jgi:uncharacterized protein (TIGR00725 family)
VRAGNGSVTAHRPLRIGIIGSARADEAAREAARRAGRALARAQAIVVCGGLGGVMAAAAEGSAAEGGLVLGFLPGEDPSSSAPGVALPVATGLGEARNVLVVRASEAVIAVAGGWGTRNEASLCLKLGIPLVGLLDTLGELFPIERFTDPDAAVARALEMATTGRREHFDRVENP